MIPVRSWDAQVVSLAPTLREGSTSLMDEVSLPTEGLGETPPLCQVFAFTVGQRGTEPDPPIQPPFWGPRPRESKRESPQAALMGVETSASICTSSLSTRNKHSISVAPRFIAASFHSCRIDILCSLPFKTQGRHSWKPHRSGPCGHSNSAPVSPWPWANPRISLSLFREGSGVRLDGFHAVFQLSVHPCLNISLYILPESTPGRVQYAHSCFPKGLSLHPWHPFCCYFLLVSPGSRWRKNGLTSLYSMVIISYTLAIEEIPAINNNDDDGNNRRNPLPVSKHWLFLFFFFLTPLCAKGLQKRS